MFKSKPRVDVSATDTLIGEGSIFEGKIKSEASIRIEGQMLGDIECDGDVTVGEHGKAKSNINARNVTIAGIVHGNITTHGTLTLTGTAQLFGNMQASSLIISEGALFQGMSKMESKASAGAKEKDTAKLESSSSGNSSLSAQPQSGYGPSTV